MYKCLYEPEKNMSWNSRPRHPLHSSFFFYMLVWPRSMTYSFPSANLHPHRKQTLISIMLPGVYFLHHILWFLKTGHPLFYFIFIPVLDVCQVLICLINCAQSPSDLPRWPWWPNPMDDDLNKYVSIDLCLTVMQISTG